MERSMVLLPALPLFVIFFLVLAAAATTSTATGFSLEIGYRRGRHINSTELVSSIAGDTDVVIRPLLQIRTDLRIEVKVKVGSEKKEFNLLLDTGGCVTWIRCGRRDPEIYDPSESTSYNKINYKRIYMKYLSGNEVEGNVANDEFAFATAEGSHQGEEVRRLVFLCADKVNAPSHMRGNLAMDRSPRSFVSQLLRGSADRKFSYCVPRLGIDVDTSEWTGFLRFGSDTGHLGSNMQSTNFVEGVVESENYEHYYLSLVKIVINGNEVAANSVTKKSWFGASKVKKVHTVIDSGSYYSFLNSEIYRKVKKILVMHFDGLGSGVRISRRSGGYGNLHLCYDTPAGFHHERHLPRISFVFGNGASLALDVWDAFEVHHDFFCLAMYEQKLFNIMKDHNLIGLFQQRNHRIIYDLGTNQLQFAPEDCSREWRRRT